MTHDTQPTEKAAAVKRRPGVSIRLLSVLLFASAVLAIAFALLQLERNTTFSHSLYELEQERQSCDKAIQQFMDGSDYLTMQIQQFVVKADRSYMDRYWEEVYVTKSRDKALEIILASNITPEEREAAASGKSESDSLIQGEIWAMRMVSESCGILEHDMPADVAAFRLTPEEQALSAAEKRAAAVAYVFGPTYSISKETIRGSVNAFRNEIANRYAEASLTALAQTESTADHMAVGLVVFFVLLLGAIVCFVTMVVTPIVGFSAELMRARDGQTAALKEHGAKEIRQFARAFNALYEQAEQNRHRLERLGYIDYLTDVPNRAGLTEFVSGEIAADQHPLGLMIVDIDNFKHYNDTYGHALGDQVLRQVAQAVYAAGTREDGISGRLCGEEFIVALKQADEDMLRQTAEAILENVRHIAGADVRLPEVKDFHVTVSIGGMIWHGEPGADFIRLLSQADKALYDSKHAGKDRYTYYRTAQA